MSIKTKISGYTGIEDSGAKKIVAGYSKAHDGKVSYNDIVELFDKASSAMLFSAISDHDASEMEHELLSCGWRRQLDAIRNWGGDAGDELITGIRCSADELAAAAFNRVKAAAEDILLGGGPEGWKNAARKFGVTWRDAEDFELGDAAGRMFAAEGTEKDFRAYMDVPRRISDATLAAIRDAMEAGRETCFSRSGVMGMLRELKNSRGIPAARKAELEPSVVKVAVEDGYEDWRGFLDPLTRLLRMRRIPETEKATVVEQYCAAAKGSSYRKAVCLLEEAYGEGTENAVTLAATTLAEMPVDGEDHIEKIYAAICPDHEARLRNALGRFIEAAKAEDGEDILTPERYIALAEENEARFFVNENRACMLWTDPLTGRSKEVEIPQADADELRKLAASVNEGARKAAFERMRLIIKKKSFTDETGELAYFKLEDWSRRSSFPMRCIASHRKGQETDIVVLERIGAGRCPYEARMKYCEIGNGSAERKQAYVSETISLGNFPEDVCLKYDQLTYGGHGPGDFDNRGGCILLKAATPGTNDWADLMVKPVAPSFLGGDEPDAIKWAHNYGTVFPDDPSPEDCLVTVAACPAEAVRALIESPLEEPARDIWSLRELLSNPRTAG